MVEVAALAAMAGAVPPVARMTATRLRTRWAARAGSRSSWFSAQRYSTAAQMVRDVQENRIKIEFKARARNSGAPLRAPRQIKNLCGEVFQAKANPPFVEMIMADLFRLPCQIRPLVEVIALELMSRFLPFMDFPLAHRVLLLLRRLLHRSSIGIRLACIKLLRRVAATDKQPLAPCARCHKKRTEDDCDFNHICLLLWLNERPPSITIIAHGPNLVLPSMNSSLMSSLPNNNFAKFVGAHEFQFGPRHSKSALRSADSIFRVVWR
jgi:hypothetical protein